MKTKISWVVQGTMSLETLNKNGKTFGFLELIPYICLMKNLIVMFTLVLGIGFASFGQDKFTYTKDGISEFVITNVDSVVVTTIYQKTIDWIGVTYKNPNEVILSKNGTNHIRFEGISENVAPVKFMGKIIYGKTRYQIVLKIKDGKYKMSVITLQNYTPPSQYSRGGWNELYLYKKNGSLHGMYKETPKGIEDYFNWLNNELKNYIIKDGNPTDNENW